MDYYLYDYDAAIGDYDDVNPYYENIPPEEQIFSLKLPERSSKEIWINCVEPSYQQIHNYILTSLGWTFGCRLGWIILWYIGSFMEGIPSSTDKTSLRLRKNKLISSSSSVIISAQHILSIFCGIGILYYTVGISCYYVIFFALISYVFIFILFKLFKMLHIGYLVGSACLIGLTICELFQANPKMWHKIRGIQMICSMKLISVAFDMDSKKIKSYLKPIESLTSTTTTATISSSSNIPSSEFISSITPSKSNNLNVFSFMGYILCPATCTLGPWISFNEYTSALINGPLFDVKWLWWTISNSIISVIFLVLSNCIIPNLISDQSWKWFTAFRDALAFRCSHYFVSYLSQATMAASGLISSVSVTGQTNSGLSGETSTFSFLPSSVTRKLKCSSLMEIITGPFFVTKPWEIEIPRSLVQVVINWNIPMHRWLKTYIFKVMKPQYGNAWAIFITYLVSSLLHGLNFQIYAVLLSLGLYTYVEYKLRMKISIAFDACILSTNCRRRQCSHKYKWSNVFVLLMNAFFSLSSILHLAYLGVMFDASNAIQEEGYSIQHALNKWQHLNFMSHWIVLVCYIFYSLI